MYTIFHNLLKLNDKLECALSTTLKGMPELHVFSDAESCAQWQQSNNSICIRLGEVTRVELTHLVKEIRQFNEKKKYYNRVDNLVSILKDNLKKQRKERGDEST